MRDTGMARKVDDLGRIVLPVELRRLHGIRPGDALAISVDGDTIVLRKIDDGCVFCRALLDLTIFHGRMVCARCIGQLNGTDGGGGHGDGVAASAVGDGAVDVDVSAPAFDRRI